MSFTPAGVVIGVKARARRLTWPCGTASRARYDSSRRRWRHLDMGATKVWLEADMARIDCRSCGRVRTQQVPWARPGARHSRDFEDVVAWLVQRTDLTTVATLMRCSWAAVHAIAERVVAHHVDTDRLEGLYRLGVDEISYRRGHHYLTIVADHDTAKVVWVAKGKRGAALEGFFDQLGGDRCAQVKAISTDLGTIYRDTARRHIPQAVICFDPFHVIHIANRARDAVYKNTGRLHASGVGDRAWRATRVALRSGAEHLSDDQHAILKALRRDRYRLWRAWELKEGLR
ncbi:MAG TPA: ISL3 family transposase, partial [Acidimicrobiales bacterium]|nr:ISL3 family transposase [Acidimicrobiales bacterium]